MAIIRRFWMIRQLMVVSANFSRHCDKLISEEYYGVGLECIGESAKACGFVPRNS